MDRGKFVYFLFLPGPVWCHLQPIFVGSNITIPLNNVATKMCGNIYINNLSVGATSVEKACVIYKEAKSIFKRTSMNLRE